MTDPTREEIHDALSSAIDNEKEWIEKFEHNEWADPNYPEAAKQSRRNEQVLTWLLAQYASPVTS